MDGWGSAIATIFGVVLLLVKQWQNNAPQREKGAAQDEDEKLRKECLDLDANAIGKRIDGVLNPASGDPTGEPDGSTKTGTASAK